MGEDLERSTLSAVLASGFALAIDKRTHAKWDSHVIPCLDEKIELGGHGKVEL